MLGRDGAGAPRIFSEEARKVKEVILTSEGYKKLKDEIEEDEPPHIPPSHDTPGHPPRLSALLARLNPIGVDPNGSDLLPVGKSLRQRHSARV